MKIKLLSFALIFLTPVFLCGQQITFSGVISTPPQSGITAHSIVPAFDNGYIIAGEAASGEGLILKIDSAGNLLWNKTISNGVSTVLNSAITTNDSCFVLVGATDNGGGYMDAFCIKINSYGDTLWSKKISEGISLQAFSVQQTNDSGYIMTGTLYFNNAPYSKIFVAKLDYAGDLQWKHNLTGGNSNNAGYSVKQTPDSGYVITGYIENYPPFDPGAFLIKLSSTGTISWSKKYSFTSNNALCSGNDLEITSDGFLCYLNGASNSMNSSVTLMKTDFYGNVLWSKEYGLPGINGDMYNPAPKIHKTSDNCYVIANGFCSGSGIAKIDTSGNIIWGTGLMLAISSEIIESKDKGFLVLGNGPMCGVKMATPYGFEIGIIKTDSLGNEPTFWCISPAVFNFSVNTIISSTATFVSSISGVGNNIQPVVSSTPLFSYTACVSAIGSVNSNNLDDNISISPNPTSGVFTIQSSDPSTPLREASIEITNVLGEKVHKSSVISNRSAVVDISNQPSGIYFVKIRSGDTVYTEKVVVQQH